MRILWSPDESPVWTWEQVHTSTLICCRLVWRCLWSCKNKEELSASNRDDSGCETSGFPKVRRQLQNLCSAPASRSKAGREFDFTPAPHFSFCSTAPQEAAELAGARSSSGCMGRCWSPAGAVHLCGCGWQWDVTMLVYIIDRKSFHNGAYGTSRRFQPLCKALNAQSSPVTLGIDH